MGFRILPAVLLLSVLVASNAGRALAQDPCASPVGASDPVDVQWSFDSGPEAWTTEGGFASTGVENGYWWGETSESPATLVSPDSLPIPGSWQGYVSITMRLRSTSASSPTFGKTQNAIYYNIDGPCCQGWQADRNRPFKAWGNGEWKTYNVWFGQAWWWVTHVIQLKIQMNVPAGTRIEIACIKVKRDLTPPAYRIKTLWNPSDGQTIVDTTPTISLEDFYDDVVFLDNGDERYVDKVEFYYRPSSNPTEEAWVLDGSDNDHADGCTHTYSQLAPGTYDFGVMAVDSSGNVASWNTGPDRWIHAVTINPSASLELDVDASAVRAPVNKDLFGNNLEWSDFNLSPTEMIFDPVTSRLPSSLESMLQELAPSVLRYPGGCIADTFYWKDSVGQPALLRPDHYATVCRLVASHTGPVLFGLDEFLTFCEVRGIKPMLTCRFRWPAGPSWPAGPGFPQKDGPDPFAQALSDAVDLVEYCNNWNDGSNPNGGTNWAAERAKNGHPEPYNVKLYEIGNEPYGPDYWGSPSRYLADGELSRHVHADGFRRFHEAMKAVDPTIEISAQTRFGEGDLRVDQTTINYQIEFMQEVAQITDLMNSHPYLPWDGDQDDPVEIYLETMASAKVLNDNISNFRTIRRFAAPERSAPEREDDLKMRFSEWQASYYYGLNNALDTSHTSTLKAALGAADMLRVMLENESTVAEACWMHLFPATPWSTFFAEPYPIYHVLRTFRRHFGDDLVQSQVSGSPVFTYTQNPPSKLRTQADLKTIEAIASVSEDRNTLYLVVINKDRFSAHTGTINIANFLPQDTAPLQTQVWEMNGLDLELNAPNINDPSIFAPSNVWMTESTAIYGRQFSYSFPAHSTISFKFRSSVPQVLTAGEAAWASGDLVRLEDKIVTAVFAPDTIYIEEPGRSAGMKVLVDSTAGIAEGNRVTVTGSVVARANEEIYIEADSLSHDSSVTPLEPLGMHREALDTPIPSYPSLLIRTWGRVASVCTDSASFMIGGTINSSCGGNRVGHKVYYSGPMPPMGEFVIVTGIKSIETPGAGRLGARVVRTRYASDVVTLDMPDVQVPSSNVGSNLQVPIQITLSAAPDAPKDVTITSANASVATISKAATAEGTASVIFANVTGTDVGTLYVQGRSVGNTTLQGSAAGYNEGVASVVVDPSAFLILYPSSIASSPGGADAAIQVVSSRLNPGSLTRATEQPVRGGLTPSVAITSSNPLVGTVTVSPLVFDPSLTSKTTAFHPLATGVSTISVVQPSGFTNPSSQGQITATVSSDINLPNSTIGKNLQTPILITLTAAPASPTDVTVKSNDPDKAILSLDPNAAGSASVTLSGVTTTTAGTVYVQGIETGAATLTATAPGYNPKTSTAQVNPSALLVLDPPSISTSPSSPDTVLHVLSSRLNASTLRRETEQPLRGGLSLDVSVTSSNTAVGTITISPLAYNPSVTSRDTWFHPAGVGATTITIHQPAGFTVPAVGGQINAVVNGDISMSSVTVGRDLQTALTVSLVHAPSGPVDLTITSNSAAIATISKDAQIEGSQSVTFTGVTDTNARTIYVQGRSLGGATLTATAGGYKNKVSSATVKPSGFLILSPASIVTTVSTGAKPVNVYSSRLNETTMMRETDQAVRGGLTVTVPIVSSNTGVGTLSVAPLVFTGGQGSRTTQFQPVAPGSSTISISAPSGFHTPAQMQSIPATVN